MIAKEEIQKVVERIIDPEKQFIVEISVKPGNKIVVSVDSFEGISLDDCVSITRGIENHFDRDIEDYELEVTSAGLSKPFKVLQQYQKNKGQKVEVVLKSGQKIKATLLSSATNGINVGVEKIRDGAGKKFREKIVRCKKRKENRITASLVLF